MIVNKQIFIAKLETVDWIKSNKGSGNFLPLQNIFNYQNSEKFVYDDEEKCVLLNKYFSFISKSRIELTKIII